MIKKNPATTGSRRTSLSTRSSSSSTESQTLLAEKISRRFKGSLITKIWYRLRRIKIHRVLKGTRYVYRPQVDERMVIDKDFTSLEEAIRCAKLMADIYEDCSCF